MSELPEGSVTVSSKVRVSELVLIIGEKKYTENEACSYNSIFIPDVCFQEYRNLLSASSGSVAVPINFTSAFSPTLWSGPASANGPALDGITLTNANAFAHPFPAEYPVTWNDRIISVSSGSSGAVNVTVGPVYEFNDTPVPISCTQE